MMHNLVDTWGLVERRGIHGNIVKVGVILGHGAEQK